MFISAKMEVESLSNFKEKARQLKTDIPALFIALKDKQTPLLAKVLAGIVVVYALSPIDLIPDFIPVLGYLDDLIILPALIAITIKLIPKDVLNKCREEAKNLGRAKQKWFYAIPFIIVWMIILLIIISFIFR